MRNRFRFVGKEVKESLGDYYVNCLILKNLGVRTEFLHPATSIIKQLKGGMIK